jgi:hypothetical protein
VPTVQVGHHQKGFFEGWGEQLELVTLDGKKFYKEKEKGKKIQIIQ